MARLRIAWCRRKFLMITLTIAAFALGVLLGLFFVVTALLFVLVAFAGLSFLVAIIVQLDLATALMLALSAEVALSMGYFGGAALRNRIRPRD
jgi:hypothetical protein